VCYQEIVCPRCSSLNIKKNGKTANHKQRDLCKDCGRQFITAYTYFGRQPGVAWLAALLTLEGCGRRATARLLGVSPNTVVAALRAEAARVPEPDVPRRIPDLELDELWSFVGAKRRRRWRWLAFDRQRRRVVAFVNGRRTDRTCERLLEKLKGCRVTRSHTDDWQAYRKYLPPKRHRVGKEGTRHIERRNLDFRTRLKRLQRRTICFSKSDELHDAAIKLHIHFSNLGQHQF
jgi:insertion element IS1 protein InsB